MTVLNRLIQGCVIAGFLVLSSGCIIAPDHGDRDMHDHEHDHHCGEHDEHCHDNR